ncbi:MAG: segregation/condensation protein A, partial [Enterococcus aquimarinus]
MQEIQIKLDVFEGPLDLLLHLIQKLEIDIYDIPIAAVTDQYMKYIRAMKAFELGVAGEYLVMAATLMAIKSQTLLPTMTSDYDFEEDYEQEDPRETLVTQLLEYRKFKYAAECLAEKAEERSQYFTKEPMNVVAFKSEEQLILKANQLTTIDLFLAFHQM